MRTSHPSPSLCLLSADQAFAEEFMKKRPQAERPEPGADRKHLSHQASGKGILPSMILHAL
jgi:hypothetical protein